MVPLNNIDIEIVNSNIMNLYIPNEKDSKLFKYEIYGNKNFHLFGSIEISKTDNISISFGIPGDDLFFIKIIVLNNCNKISNVYTRFYNYIPLNLSRNLSMDILKKKTINEKKIKVIYDNSTLNSYDRENESNQISESENESNQIFESDNEYDNSDLKNNNLHVNNINKNSSDTESNKFSEINLSEINE